MNLAVVIYSLHFVIKGILKKLKVGSENLYINYGVLLILFLISSLMGIHKLDSTTFLIGEMTWQKILFIGCIFSVLLKETSLFSRQSLCFCLGMLIFKDINLLAIMSLVFFSLKTSSKNKPRFALILITLFSIFLSPTFSYFGHFALLMTVLALAKSHEENIETSLFPVRTLTAIIVFSRFSEYLIIDQAMKGLVLFLVLPYLWKHSKKLLNREKLNKKGLLILSLIFAGIFSYWNLFDHFYFLTSLLILVSFLINLKSNNSRDLGWSLFFVLLFVSPPFGIGYVLKTSIVKTILSFNSMQLLPFILALLLIQFVALRSFMFELLRNIQEIKDKKFSVDSLTIAMILVSAALSILFLPSSWSETYGNLFFRFSDPPRWSPDVIEGVGYYIFWIEVLFWVIAGAIIYKSERRLWKKLIYKSNLVKQSDPKEAVNSKVQLVHEKGNSRGLVLSLNFSLENLSAEAFQLVMVLLFSVFLLGVL